MAMKVIDCPVCQQPVGQAQDHSDAYNGVVYWVHRTCLRLKCDMVDGQAVVVQKAA